MNRPDTIKDRDDIEKIKNYYRDVKPNIRNELLIIMGLNTALRVSDLLNIKWADVYNFNERCFKRHLKVKEKKTGKMSSIYLNDSIMEVLNKYKKKQRIEKDKYIFVHSNKNVPITRCQAWRIIKRCARWVGIDGVISAHSLRKAFGYQAWKKGTQPALLMAIYNHSSYEVTKRYLGIEQDERDEVFKSVRL